MSSISFFLLCIQALLIQNAFSQVITRGYNGLEVEVDAVSSAAAGLSGYGLNGISLGNSGLSLNGIGNSGLALNGIGNSGLAINGIGNSGISLGNSYGLGVQDVAAVATLPVSGPYGGSGYGEISVGGEVSAAGNTVITGQVPVIGVVSFSGDIPASGIVSIAGNCGCAGVPL